MKRRVVIDIEECDEIRLKYSFEISFHSQYWNDRPALMETIKETAGSVLRAVEKLYYGIADLDLVLGVDVSMLKDGKEIDHRVMPIDFDNESLH